MERVGMDAGTAPRVWRAIGRSCDGSAHRRIQLPNQDAIRLWEPRGGGPPLIVAVADGHGGSMHFRSATGSAIAVEVAEGVLRELVEHGGGDGSDAVELPDRGATLRREIVARWRTRVAADLAAHPLTTEERDRLSRGNGAAEAAAEASAETAASAETVESPADMFEPIVAYGSTLLAGLLTARTLVLLQIGDGDILSVDASGMSSRPFPHDARLVGNLTTSLCLPDAVAEIRVIVRPLTGGADDPVLLLFSTDGYANSFVSLADFERVGPDYLALAREHGVGWLADALPGFLREASEHGSGDDVTVAILTCEGSAPPANAATLPPVAAIDWIEPTPAPSVTGARDDTRVSLGGLIVIIIGVLIVAFFAWRVLSRPLGHLAPRGHPGGGDPAADSAAATPPPSGSAPSQTQHPVADPNAGAGSRPSP